MQRMYVYVIDSEMVKYSLDGSRSPVVTMRCDFTWESAENLEGAPVEVSAEQMRNAFARIALLVGTGRRSWDFDVCKRV